jgi:uncharacterized repeat protein (TIGR03806 family)
VTARRIAGVAVAIVCSLNLVLDGRARGAEEATPPRAPERLSATGLYVDAAALRVAEENLPFEPQYPLWTDGADKSRWIQLPAGAKIDASDVNRWSFPVGTKLWKEFALDGRRIETRMLWRASAAEWVFASYVWNEEQTDAVLAPSAGIRNHYLMKSGATYAIPAESDCRACHESGGTPVLGFNALQLSDDRDPLAPHAQAAGAGSLTLATLERLALVQSRRPELVSSPPRIAASSPVERAALGYLSTNCGSCHNSRGPLAGLGLDLQYDGNVDRQAAFRTAVNVSGDYVTPGVDAAHSRRIAPGSPESSAIVYRMSSRRPASQMPPLGTAVVDREGVELVRAWIRELRAAR